MALPPKKKTELTSLLGHVTLDKTQELYNHVIKIFGKPGYVEQTLAQLGRGEAVKLGGCYDCLHVTIGDAIADMQEVREVCATYGATCRPVASMPGVLFG
jgi:hypothetical protein